MKYLKLFEDYKSAEDVEDILLPFIDDGLCKVRNFGEINEFKFDENTLKLAEDRLRKFGIENYLMINEEHFSKFSIFYIYRYSSIIENDILNTINKSSRTRSGSSFYYNYNSERVFKQNTRKKIFYVNINIINDLLRKCGTLHFMVNSTTVILKLITKLYLSKKQHITNLEGYTFEIY